MRQTRTRRTHCLFHSTHTTFFTSFRLRFAFNFFFFRLQSLRLAIAKQLYSLSPEIFVFSEAIIATTCSPLRQEAERTIIISPVIMAGRDLCVKVLPEVSKSPLLCAARRLANYKLCAISRYRMQRGASLYPVEMFGSESRPKSPNSLQFHNLHSNPSKTRRTRAQLPHYHEPKSGNSVLTF